MEILVREIVLNVYSKLDDKISLYVVYLSHGQSFRSLIYIELGWAKTILKYRFRTNKCQKRLEMGKLHR